MRPTDGTEMFVGVDLADGESRQVVVLRDSQTGEIVDPDYRPRGVLLTEDADGNQIVIQPEDIQSMVDPKLPHESWLPPVNVPSLAERRSIRNRNLFAHVIAGVMANLGASKKVRYSTATKYEPCPCGSGKKFKFCCMGK